MALAILAIPLTLSGAEKARYFPVCRAISSKPDESSHCMPAVVLLKSENMNRGQRFLVLGGEPAKPETLSYYDLTMDVLLYYRVGEKLEEKTRQGEDAWRFHYAAAVYWCLGAAAGSKENPAPDPASPVACGATHGIWDRKFQGRGPGGMDPTAVSQYIMRGVMPRVAADIPASPPKTPWQGYRLVSIKKGEKPGRLCREQVMANEWARDQFKRILAAELRGTRVPSAGGGEASLVFCDGNDIVVTTDVPEADFRCTVEPPFDEADIDTIAGNCARDIGEALRAGRTKL